MAAAGSSSCAEFVITLRHGGPPPIAATRASPSRRRLCCLVASLPAKGTHSDQSSTGQLVLSLCFAPTNFHPVSMRSCQQCPCPHHHSPNPGSCWSNGCPGLQIYTYLNWNLVDLVVGLAAVLRISCRLRCYWEELVLAGCWELLCRTCWWRSCPYSKTRASSGSWSTILTANYFYISLLVFRCWCAPSIWALALCSSAPRRDCCLLPSSGLRRDRSATFMELGCARIGEEPTTARFVSCSNSLIKCLQIGYWYHYWAHFAPSRPTSMSYEETFCVRRRNWDWRIHPYLEGSL